MRYIVYLLHRLMYPCLVYTAKPRSVWETVEWRRGRRDGVIDGDVMANQYGSGRDGAG